MRPSLALAPALLLVAAGACGPDGGASGSPPVDPTATPGEPGPGSAKAPEPVPGDEPAPAKPTPPGPTSPSIPGALSCLAQHYLGTPTPKGSGFVLALPGGKELAWNDGKTKTFDEALAEPDLEDTLAMPYPLGAIKPVTTVNQDPGRIRSDALLETKYGASEAAVQAELVSTTFVGQTVKFHKLAAPALAKVSARLEKAIATTPSLSAYVTGTLGGTFAWRPIVNTNRRSAHSYGIAIDIVVDKSNYWEWEKQNGQIVWANKIPQAIVDAFEAEGFAWGGRWYHYDTMHFEYRPELFDAACKP